MSLNSIMGLGRLALSTHQTSIEVAGHNVANVNTEGYSRQQALVEVNEPLATTPGSIGTGMKIVEITRSYDRFLNIQINNQNSLLGKWDIKEEILVQTEVVLNENVGNGLNESMSTFFNNWQGLSADPQSQTLRQTLLGSGQIMVDSFNRIGDNLSRLIENVDDKIKVDVKKINGFSEKIARLNKLIHDSESGQNNANDLRDTRDLLTKDLSKLIDLNFIDQNNQFVIFSRSGFTLVAGDTAFNLSTRPNSINPSISDVILQNVNGTATDVTSNISDGELKGLIETRDNHLSKYLNKIDSLSSGIIRMVNSGHRSGYGIDKSTGVDFFNTQNVTVKYDITNTGTGLITSQAVSNPVDVTDNIFEMVFTSPGTFRLDNLTMGTVDGNYSFTSGSPVSRLQALGISVTISGSPAANDRFKVSVTENSAKNIRLNSTVVNDIKKIAASNTPVAGDGGNATGIASLQRSQGMGRGANAASGAFTFDDYFNSLIGMLGDETATSISNTTLSESVVLQLENRREQIAGVNIDEEVINMVRFQAAYSAAAKLISTVDEMLQTLMTVGR